MSYEALLDDLETLQKSYAAADEDDKKIQAAAADADDSKEDDDDEDEGREDGANASEAPVAAEPDGNKKPAFAKSFNVKTESGEPFEAFDGTELVKALSDRVDLLARGVDAEKEDLTKSLTILTDVIKQQGKLLKSLQDGFEELSKQGRGRMSVVSPTLEMAKGMRADQPLNAQTLMAKANAAFDAGRISGKDLTICDVALRYGTEIDPAILGKIMVG